MELISPTIQDRVITPAIILGIGAASGAAQAVIFNHINEQNSIDERYSIFKSAAISAVGTLPSIIIHEFYLFDNKKLLNDVIKSEALKNIALPTIYSSYVKKYRAEKDSFHNSLYNTPGNPDTATSLATFNGPPIVHRFTARTKMASELTSLFGNLFFTGYLTLSVIFGHLTIKPRFPYQTGA